MLKELLSVTAALKGNHEASVIVFRSFRLNWFNLKLQENPAWWQMSSHSQGLCFTFDDKRDIGSLIWLFYLLRLVLPMVSDGVGEFAGQYRQG